MPSIGIWLALEGFKLRAFDARTVGVAVAIADGLLADDARRVLAVDGFDATGQ